MLEFAKTVFIKLFIIDCAGCGSLVVKESGLCASCFNLINLNYRKKSSDVYRTASGLNYQFIYHWHPHTSDILSCYVHFLKSKLAKLAWHEIAKQVEPLSENKHKKTTYIPIPSRTGRPHSHNFAFSLALQNNGTVAEALTVVLNSALEQKEKTKQERCDVSFNLNEVFTEVLRQSDHIILVDDVITTGSSYEAAYKAIDDKLLCRKNISLIAAFHREKEHSI